MRQARPLAASRLASLRAQPANAHLDPAKLRRDSDARAAKSSLTCTSGTNGQPLAGRRHARRPTGPLGRCRPLPQGPTALMQEMDRVATIQVRPHASGLREARRAARLGGRSTCSSSLTLDPGVCICALVRPPCAQNDLVRHEQVSCRPGLAGRPKWSHAPAPARCVCLSVCLGGAWAPPNQRRAVAARRRPRAHQA